MGFNGYHFDIGTSLQIFCVGKAINPSDFSSIRSLILAEFLNFH